MMRKKQAKQAAKDGFIPTGGSLITVSMHVPDPKTPSGTRQVRLPYESVSWLLQKLEAQGLTLQDLETMNDGVVADMMKRMGQQQAPRPPQQLGPPMVQ